MKLSRRPVRVLFVLARLENSVAETQIGNLHKSFDPLDFHLDVVVCAPPLSTEIFRIQQREGEGLDVDRTPYDLSFEDTVAYLSHRLPAYDVVVSCQNVVNVYPVLDQLCWHPPLIEFGDKITDPTAGPKRFIPCVSTSASVRTSAATRMPGRVEDAIKIPPVDDSQNLSAWRDMLLNVLRERKAAPAPTIFSSWIQGGFECSTHVRRDGRRLDLLATTHHDRNAHLDYRLLQEHGIYTVRDGVRWHLIEKSAGKYDWRSLLPMLRASECTATQVIWDLMHYGWPQDLDIWSPSFVDRFARFAAEVARVVKGETTTVPFYCPVNEISFHAWAGGDVAYLNPFARGRSFELKAQLARASIAAMNEILQVEPEARFVHCEPIIHIVASSNAERLAAEHARQAQFQAFDMISGALWPQLGGEPRLLDIVGVNYYSQNQWTLGGGPLDRLDSHYLPFRALLTEVYARYGRSVLVSETGTEGNDRASWFDTITRETITARQAGVPIEGVCLYPIVDHIGWDDDRACPSGLLGSQLVQGGRTIHTPLALAVAGFHKENMELRPLAVPSQGACASSLLSDQLTVATVP